VKAELALAESSLQIGDELSPKEAAEHFDRKQELPAAGNPAAPVGRDAAAGHDTMEMGMMQAARTIP
jgi:hypothetical protein